MKIDVQIDVAPLLLRLRNGEKRLAYGVVNALNATARRIQDAERERVQSTFVLRKRDFILREIAKIRRTSFANVRQGRAWVEIEVGQKRRLLLSQFEAGGTRAALKGKRPVFFPRPQRKFIDTPVYDYGRLGVGAVVKGPAVIELPFTTTLVPPDHKITVDPYMNLVMEIP